MIFIPTAIKKLESFKYESIWSNGWWL